MRMPLNQPDLELLGAEVGDFLEVRTYKDKIVVTKDE